MWPTKDAPTVARLRAAGAIVIGKTNTPEMTMDYDCDNPVFGQTNNPWNHERVPGGSSGGEAAALAAGMSPLGMGSDYRGSIRVPAHFCGIVGLKPTWGTIPCSGHMAPSIASPPPIAHMATIGPMARYVDDLTLAYNIVKGQHPSSPYTVPTPLAEPEKIDLKKIRCAIFTDACDVPVTADTRAAIERAGRELQKMGIVVEAVKPPVDEGDRLWWAYNGADGNQLVTEALGEHLKLSRDRLRSFMVASEGKSAAEFFKIAMERDAWRVQLAEFMERYPIILGPTFCVTAFKHGATEVDIDGKKFSALPGRMAGGVGQLRRTAGRGRAMRQRSRGVADRTADRRPRIRREHRARSREGGGGRAGRISETSGRVRNLTLARVGRRNRRRLAEHSHPVANQRRQPLDSRQQFGLLLARRVGHFGGGNGQVLAHQLHRALETLALGDTRASFAPRLLDLGKIDYLRHLRIQHFAVTIIAHRARA